MHRPDHRPVFASSSEFAAYAHIHTPDDDDAFPIIDSKD
jgi:hypothetical protein